METEKISPRRIIATDSAPAAIGPYSQAVQVGNFLFVAGQLGLDPTTGEMVPGGVQAEARQALSNASAILEAAGFTLADTVQVQVLLADMADFTAMNEVYATFFPDAPPARAAFAAAALPRGGRVEVVVTAGK